MSSGLTDGHNAVREILAMDRSSATLELDSWMAGCSGQLSTRDVTVSAVIVTCLGSEPVSVAAAVAPLLPDSASAQNRCPLLSASHERCGKVLYVCAAKCPA